MSQTLEKGSVSSPSTRLDGVMITKAGGKREPFIPEKLETSLRRAGASDSAIESILEHIEPEVYEGISTDDIYRHAFALLHKKAKPVARKYSLRRAVMELGPSGFPFEDFVAQILDAKGYQTLTRQSVLGVCVPHEIDVVAWDNEDLIMVEAKFHNEHGTKSDLKVALYMKARFDDVEGNVFDYGGKDRKITESWLVTNTKFSSTAIHYGVCQKLTMIGWNYPATGNLQDMIEETRLHPITCLTTLTTEEKKALMEARVVLCSSIKSEPEILKQVLGEDFDSAPVLEEVNEL